MMLYSWSPQNRRKQKIWTQDQSKCRKTLSDTESYFTIFIDDIHSGADKSLARQGRKQATFSAFYGT